MRVIRGKVIKKQVEKNRIQFLIITNHYKISNDLQTLYYFCNKFWGNSSM